MKDHIKHIVIISLVMWGLAQAQVSEIVVSFENEGQAVMGTLAVPNDATDYPLVLLLHGFTGTRDELPVLGTEEGMFSRSARVLAEQGYASLRIDFRGSGESDGEWADTTFGGQISDARAALDYIETLPDVDTARIGVIGLSQGGLVAASIADDPRVASLILWSPVANPPSTYATIVGTDVVQAALQTEGATTFMLPWGEETTLGRGFFDGLYAVDPIAEITAYSGPLFVIVGALDDTVAPQPYYGQIYVDYHSGESNLLVLEQGDHVFNVLSTGSELLDEVISASVSWFEETL
ncbi:MAG: alpha/beta fold hydrolase [Deinococcota bacterium]